MLKFSIFSKSEKSISLWVHVYSATEHAWVSPGPAKMDMFKPTQAPCDYIGRPDSWDLVVFSRMHSYNRTSVGVFGHFLTSAFLLSLGIIY